MYLPFDPRNPEDKQACRHWLSRNAGILTSKQFTDGYFKRASTANFRNVYNRFVSAYSAEAKIISNLRPDGIGPGEMVAWYVFDNITLGGRNSGIDLLMSGKPFAEMKAGRHNQTHNSVDDFKITKDGDPSVIQIMADLHEYAMVYEKLHGLKLKVSSISAKFLEANMAKNISKVELTKVPLILDRNTLELTDPEGNEICNLDNQDLYNNVVRFAYDYRPPAVDNSISTFKKIVTRWRKQAYQDALVVKKLALVNKDSLMMMYFGQLTEGNIGLYRIHRNQPWARIYLPSTRAL